LHWASINAQLPACRYLLEQGAEVDALGGDLIATPMQWAARGGYLYIIQLLIAHGADPNIKDAQGYNTLHLVTHSSSIMPLLYLLHQPISVDERDSAGHTALMWAAYQGDALSVDLLLKHGSSVTVRDDAGLTPLHWAVVRGNKICIRRLVEHGAEVGAKDNEGRTARDMAVELKSLGAYKRALEEGALNEDGSLKKRPLSEVSTDLSQSRSRLTVTRRGTRKWQFLCSPRSSCSLFLQPSPSCRGTRVSSLPWPSSLVCTTYGLSCRPSIPRPEQSADRNPRVAK
jgi:ankyrin repeat protein